MNDELLSGLRVRSGHRQRVNTNKTEIVNKVMSFEETRFDCNFSLASKIEEWIRDNVTMIDGDDYAKYSIDPLNFLVRH